MESGYEPFGVVEEDGRTILRLHGTEEQRVRVEADRVHIIMDAIVQEWGIDIEYADIEGDLDISAANGVLDYDDGRLIVSSSISIESSRFIGNVSFDCAHFSDSISFRLTSFEDDASFVGALFDHDVNFHQASFAENVSFAGAEFHGYAPFIRVRFGRDVNFRAAIMAHPVSFSEVQYNENTVFAGIWNNIIRRLLSKFQKRFRTFLHGCDDYIM